MNVIFMEFSANMDFRITEFKIRKSFKLRWFIRPTYEGQSIQLPMETPRNWRRVLRV